MANQVTKKLVVHIGALISILVVCVALWVMNKTLHSININDIIEHLRELSFWAIFFALILTAASYFVVTGYDVIALEHVGRRVPYPRAALSAFLASTFGNNIGFAVLTGTSIRYRTYSQVGLSALDIAGVSSMCALTTILGMSTIFGISMFLQTGDVATTGIPIPPQFMRFAGGLVLAALIGYLIYTSYKPLTLHTKSWSIRMPSSRTALAQIILATTNLSLVASLIYFLLPSDIETGYMAFLSVFALALIAGSASNVPGGIGVFESVILIGLPEIPTAALLGSILVFRCIYYLTPLVVASILLAVHEGAKQRANIDKIHDSTLDLLDEVGPQLMSMIVLFAGMLLLFSGSIPTGFDRDQSLTYVPLLTVEIAHLLGAVAGIGLLINARGIARRLATSFNLVTILLVTGIVTSLYKGFGYREAIVLGCILALLWRTQPEFYRRNTLFNEGYPVEWVSLLSVVIAVTIWLGLFAFKDIPYTADLWWTFDPNLDFARFLRSILVVLSISGIVTYINLVRPDPLPALPEENVLDKVRQILKTEQNPRANLVLLGDKRLRFSPSGKTFLMYQVHGKSWVVLGGPVGPVDEHEEMIASFCSLCDRYGAWPVFYLVGAENLFRYVKLGLSADPIDDDAMLPLKDFSLKGAMKTELNEVHTRVKKQGATLEIIDANGISALIPQLRDISNDWLKTTHSAETGFAKGFFDPYYVINFPCAVVRVKNKIVAFAVIWSSPNKDQMILDLMRYHHDAPKNIIDFMVIDLILKAQKQGYRWFNLGAAPISGFINHPLEPIWSRVSVLMYQPHGTLKDVTTLRDQYARFDPEWRPKYIVTPGSHKLPHIFDDIARLISSPKIRAERGDTKELE